MSETARDVMTSPAISVTKDNTLEEVIDIFSRHNFSGLPVVDEQNKVIGVLSEADIVKYSHQESVIPLTSSFGWISPYTEIRDIATFRKGVETLSWTKVERVMTKNVVTVSEDTLADDIAQKMTKRNVNRIPVVDSQGRLVGIVTRADLIRTMSRKKEAEEAAE